jgi:hypothetical protein
MNPIAQVQDLVKALEAGSYDAAPSSLTQGSALQIEDLQTVMNVVCADMSHLKLQKMLSTESCKSITWQFNRQLSYGINGGSAAMEGNVGQEETSDYVRVTVPITFYSSIRRVTIASTLVDTADGKKSDERAAADAAIKIAMDVEFDLFRGLDDFSNAGVFDGNPMTTSQDMPNMHGLGLQIRQSDFQANSRDQLFAEFGSDESVVLSAGGSTLTQGLIEDGALRSSLGFGEADKLVVDPVALANYNKLTFGLQKIVLAGSPQDATGGDLRRQWVSGGTVNIEASQFLRAKVKPSRARANGPAAPQSVTGVAASATNATGLAAGDYIYYVTAGNEIGESVPCAAVTVSGVTANYKVTLTITHSASGVSRFYNVYRTAAGGAQSSAKFIGRVVPTVGSSTTSFVDLNGRIPGFTTGYFLQKDGAQIRQLAPYSRLKLAVSDLSMPEAHFRFLGLAVPTPRKFVLIDNVKGTL